MLKKISLSDSNPICPDTFTKIIKDWCSGIHSGDVTAVVSYPASDRQRRILQFLDSPNLIKKYFSKANQPIFIMIDFRTDPIEDAQELETQIVNKVKNIQKFPKNCNLTLSSISAVLKSSHKFLVVIGMGAEAILTETKSPLLIPITNSNRLDEYRMVLFFETNIFSAQNNAILAKYPLFQPTIHYLSTYDQYNCQQFMDYLTKWKWQVQIPATIKQSIINQAGGLLYFEKIAVRLIREYPNLVTTDTWQHPILQQAIVTLATNFTPEEQEILKRIASNQKVDKLHDRPIVDYLLQTGIISNTSGKLAILSPALHTYFQSQIVSSTTLILDSHLKLFLDNIDITSYFSAIEQKLLIYGISNLNTCIDRDIIASVIWPNDDGTHYSNWAIDSHISRLRKKLKSNGILNPEILVKKGIGVIFQQNV
jgi:hypothetical protein